MKKVSIMVAVASLIVLQGCSQQKPAVISQCSVDEIEGSGRLPDGNFVAIPGAKLKALGWFADTFLGTYPKKVTFLLVDKVGNVFVQGSGDTGVSRPDLVEGFKKSSLKDAGFSLGFDLNKSLSSDTYAIVLNGEFSGKEGVCSTNRTIKITN